MLKSLVAACVAVVLLAAPAAAQQQLKIGVVDMDVVMNDSSLGKKASQAVATYMNKAQAELETEQAALSKLRQDMARDASTKTEAQRAEAERQYNIRDAALKAQLENTQRTADRMMQSESAKVRDAAMVAAKKLRDTEQYSLIIDAKQVFVSTPQMDVTARVISLMPK